MTASLRQEITMDDFQILVLSVLDTVRLENMPTHLCTVCAPSVSACTKSSHRWWSRNQNLRL